MVKKRVSPRHPWALKMAPRLGTTGIVCCYLQILGTKQMLDCKHKQHRLGRPQIFFQGRQSRHFRCPFQAADDTNANRLSHNALPLLQHNEVDPRYCNSPKNALRWQQCFFSHRTKLVGSNISFQFSHLMFLFTPWFIAISSRCITCHRCLRLTVTCSKTPTAVTSVNLCCHVIVTR